MKKLLFAITIASFIFPAALSGQAANPKPQIVPAVQKWQGAQGKLNVKTFRFAQAEGSAFPVGSETGETFLKYFADELNAEAGIKYGENGIQIIFAGALPADVEGRDDAYEIEIGNEIVIRAGSYNSYVLASRSLLQMFRQYKNSLPKGRISDWSVYGKRMLMLDVARTWFPADVLKDYIREMAWLKMNELHLHLSDCSWESFGDYYRLPSDVEPKLTNELHHYTWDEIAELIKFAKVYGIVITPEIDTPGHSRSFVRARPELGSPYHPKNKQSDTFLDITNPASDSLVQAVIAEVSSHFESTDFHIGTDEYMLRNIKDEELKNKLGEDFRKYLNRTAEFVVSLGKTPRVWTGYEKMPGQTEPDKNVVVDMWDAHDAKNKSADGYRFINSCDVFNYIVPSGRIKRYMTDFTFVYEKWTPLVFSRDGSGDLTPQSKGLIGSKLNVWNDFGPTGFTMSEMSRCVVPSMVVFGEKMWGSAPNYKTYNSFVPLQNRMMEAPLTTFLDRDREAKKLVYSVENVDMQQMNIAKSLDLPVKEFEYPFTLEAQLMRTVRSDKNSPETLLSSEYATVYAYFNHIVPFEGGLKDEHEGIVIVRAQREPGLTPYTSQYPQVLVYKAALPFTKSVSLKIVGEKQRTRVWIDGVLISDEKLQSILPLEYFGDKNGNNFKGIIESLKVYNYVR